MANGESSSVFGGGFVQKACQASAQPTTPCRCRLCERARAMDRMAARCACGSRTCLVLVEVVTCGVHLAPGEERYTFQWMCPACRQQGCPF